MSQQIVANLECVVIDSESADLECELDKEMKDRKRKVNERQTRESDTLPLGK